MSRVSVAVCLLLLACGSNSDGAKESGAGGAAGDACPDVSGTWKVSEHCDASLVGLSLTATEKDCALSFAPPFDQFMGTVGADGRITLSGPQSCTGNATPGAISMVCTPGTCKVTLTR